MSMLMHYFLQILKISCSHYDMMSQYCCYALTYSIKYLTITNIVHNCLNSLYILYLQKSSILYHGQMDYWMNCSIAPTATVYMISDATSVMWDPSLSHTPGPSLVLSHNKPSLPSGECFTLTNHVTRCPRRRWLEYRELFPNANQIGKLQAVALPKYLTCSKGKSKGLWINMRPQQNISGEHTGVNALNKHPVK